MDKGTSSKQAPQISKVEQPMLHAPHHWYWALKLHAYVTRGTRARDKAKISASCDTWRYFPQLLPRLQGMDRPGVRKVPKGSGEHGKMEETGCEILCGTPTTLVVKRYMKMIMKKKSGSSISKQGNVNPYLNMPFTLSLCERLRKKSSKYFFFWKGNSV